jgi:hypothetical protein
MADFGEFDWRGNSGVDWAHSGRTGTADLGNERRSRAKGRRNALSSGLKMKLEKDNRAGMWLCNVLMTRKDVTEEEKKTITEIQRQILANPITFKPTTEQIFWLKRIWSRDKHNGKPKKIKVEVSGTWLTTDEGREIEGLQVQCLYCGHEVQVYGTSIRSAKRGAVMLRGQCPYSEKNFYDVEWSQEGVTV